LPSRELLGLEDDELPSFLVAVVKALDRVDVLLCRIGDSAEHVDKAVKERAASMVVPALVQLRQVEPDIDIYVVALGLDVGLVVLLARTGHHDELV
jgi:hypothetical protein